MRLVKTRIENLSKRKKILIRSSGKMPKDGNLYNILRIISIEPATKAQISKFLANPSSISIAKRRGYVSEIDGEFVLTESGYDQLTSLKKRFDTMGEN